MRPPTLDELPSPPHGKTGWPWTEASPRVSDSVPRVSVVTPSYNQAQFLEETIRSVLLQGYPNLEYIIIDGESTDNSVEIIRQYENWLTYWVSEKDRGQTDAINKGFARATGEICAWLNSDDVYLPGVINDAVRYFEGHSQTMVVYGDAEFVDASGNRLQRFQTKNFRPPQMFFDHFIPQPAAFIRRVALEQAGGLDESLHFCMDYDLWLRIALQDRIDYLPHTWAWYRLHAASKGSNLQALRWAETAKILAACFDRRDVPHPWQKYRADAVGRAHWHAAIQYVRAHDDEKTAQHIRLALADAPQYMVSREFAGFLVGGVAAGVDDDTLTLVSAFFDLIPDTVLRKQQSCQRARARVDALLALNGSTPRDAARRYARRALRLDQSWIANRHVVSRAL